MNSKRKPLVFVLLILLLMLGTGLFSFYFFLPLYIEQKILPDLGQRLSTSLSGRVYDLGLSSADLGEFVLGPPENPGLSVDHLRVEYSLSSLLDGKTGLITINGPRLNLKYADSTFTVPGLDLEKLGPAPGDRNTPDHQPEVIMLPLLPAGLQVQNGLVSLLYENEQVLVPFALQVSPAEGHRQPAYRFSLQLEPQGESITVEGIAHLSENYAEFTFGAPSFDLNRFLLLANIPAADLSMGDIALQGGARIALKPLQLEEARFAAELDPIQIKGMPIGFDTAAGTTESPADISLVLKKEQGRWQITAGAAISEPVAVSLALQSTTVMDREGLRSAGNFSLKTAALQNEQQLQAVTIIKNFSSLNGDFKYAVLKDGNWQAEIVSPGAETRANKPESLRVRFADIILQTAEPDFMLKGAGSGTQDELELKLTLPEVEAKSGGLEVRIPGAGLRASYRQEKSQEGRAGGNGEFNLTLQGSRLNRNGLAARADISLQGKIVKPLTGGREPLQIFGTAKIGKAEIRDADSNIKIEELAGKIPWQWPRTDRESSGEIQAAGLSFNGYDLGGFRANLQLQDMTYFLEGSHTSNLLPGVVALISGRADLAGPDPQAELTARIEPTRLTGLHLGKFDQALVNSYFSGVLGLESSLRLASSGSRGKMKFTVQQGSLELSEKKYTAEGIDLSLLLPGLPDLRSAPAQKISFNRAAAGNLVFEAGEIVWQLESPDSIFIEEGVFNWAGGRIFTNSVRLTGGMQEVAMPIFCDRLILAELLEQFGVSNAQGEGTVSGRIPLTVGRSRVHFKDGFLYSSPGQGGSIRVAAFDTLAAGIPQNTPQFAQIDFAAAALKNFNYNWVKLLFNTEGEELVMQMQMDGKPVQSLPFRYDSRTGALQRLENGDRGIDQPIRLEVNFRLPLNRFLGYSGRIQDIMRQIQ